jgi:hypothetical protein
LKVLIKLQTHGLTFCFNLLFTNPTMNRSTALICVAGAFAVIWGLTYHGVIFTAFFAPKFEDVRRKTFENSRSFQGGTLKELRDMQFAYVKADPTHRAGLAYLIRQRADDYQGQLPQDLANFLNTLPTQ